MTSTRTRTNLNRRTLLAAAGSAGTALAAPAAVRAQGGARELRMATAWPKGSAGLGANAQRLADMITAMSGGRLTVQVYAAGELVSPLAAFDAVSDGAPTCCIPRRTLRPARTRCSGSLATCRSA
jgi:TRAP-type mannitol/chloroaromatic compound transport system substrate-binding protein